jgi:hypothetical protein
MRLQMVMNWMQQRMLEDLSALEPQVLLPLLALVSLLQAVVGPEQRSLCGAGLPVSCSQ